MSDKPTLLPPNATPLERALEQALARIEDVPVPVDTLWNPNRCPADLLPWLAWAWSVDEWDPEWPEAVKRRVIAASPAVHRRKGTRAAVRDALAALGIAVDIDEWWQRQPKGQPGTFRVTAWLDGWDVPGAEQMTTAPALIRRAVRPVKPVSRAYDVRLGMRSNGPERMAMTTTTSSSLLTYPPIPRQVAAPGPLGVASGAQASAAIRVAPPLARERQASGPLTMAPAMQTILQLEVHPQ